MTTNFATAGEHCGQSIQLRSTAHCAGPLPALQLSVWSWSLQQQKEGEGRGQDSFQQET